MQLPTRFTVKPVSVQFMLHLDLLYAIQDNLLGQPVGFFYTKWQADIAAKALEISISTPISLEIQRLAEILA